MTAPAGAAAPLSAGVLSQLMNNKPTQRSKELSFRGFIYSPLQSRNVSSCLQNSEAEDPNFAQISDEMSPCSFSDQMPAPHEVAISTVILEFQEITLRSAASTLPGRVAGNGGAPSSRDNITLV